MPSSALQSAQYQQALAGAAVGAAAVASRPSTRSLAQALGSHNTLETSAAAVSVYEDANRGFRPYMEDGYKVVDPWGPSKESSAAIGFFAVYDGHGGRQATDYCLAKMHEVLFGELQQNGGMRTRSDFEKAFERTFLKVDDQLRLVGAWHCGCTATVAVLQRRGNAGAPARLYVANVGDSRAVLCGADEDFEAAGPPVFRRASVDHKASDPEEVRRIIREGGIISRGRVGGSLILSRALGDHALKTSGVSAVPYVFCHELSGGWEKALVIASDGVWDVISDEDAARLVMSFLESALPDVAQRSEKELRHHVEQRAALLLVDTALQRGSTDNVTAMVVFL